MENLSKKRGAKPLSGAAMTAAQRKQRERAKQTCYIKAAENSGFDAYSVLISQNQLNSLRKFWHIDDLNSNRRLGGDGLGLTPRKVTSEMVNEVIYYALNMYLRAVEERLIGEGVPPDIVQLCVDPNRHQVDHKNLYQVEIESARLFQEWEKSQITSKEGSQ